MEHSKMIQIFGIQKSFDCKTAQRWFSDRRIPFQFVDLKEKLYIQPLLELCY